MNPNLTANLRADRELRAKILKTELEQSLKKALPYLQTAYDAAVKAGLRESDYELLATLGDSLTACKEALERLNDTGEE